MRLPMSSRILPDLARLSESWRNTVACGMLPAVMRMCKSSGGGVLNTCCRSSRAAVTTLWSQCWVWCRVSSYTFVAHKERSTKTQNNLFYTQPLILRPLPVEVVQVSAAHRPPSSWLQNCLWGWWCWLAAAAEASGSGGLTALRESDDWGAHHPREPTDLEEDTMSECVHLKVWRLCASANCSMCPTQQHI